MWERETVTWNMLSVTVTAETESHAPFCFVGDDIIWHASSLRSVTDNCFSELCHCKGHLKSVCVCVFCTYMVFCHKHNLLWEFYFSLKTCLNILLFSFFLDYRLEMFDRLFGITMPAIWELFFHFHLFDTVVVHTISLLSSLFFSLQLIS